MQRWHIPIRTEIEEVISYTAPPLLLSRSVPEPHAVNTRPGDVLAIERGEFTPETFGVEFRPALLVAE